MTAGAARLIERGADAGIDIRSYGESPEADFHMVDIQPSASGWSFDTAHNGVRLGRVELPSIRASQCFECPSGAGRHDRYGFHVSPGNQWVEQV